MAEYYNIIRRDLLILANHIDANSVSQDYILYRVEWLLERLGQVSAVTEVLFPIVSDWFSTLSDDELDGIVSEIHQNLPDAGYRMMLGHLKSRGIRIQSKVA
ncbi:uncharacterized protein zgc:174680 [Polyodon spathula]|uniref:uncharacterized protein zgc:174680 n=1 Tax=Polyodon spathula TaxID=7913 RepID=UPI001B7E49C7|nr:uncharacterized protein zgc:174680 [Polyodon spathula]